jgi:hypothetical protein
MTAKRLQQLFDPSLARGSAPTPVVRSGAVHVWVRAGPCLRAPQRRGRGA